MITSIQPTKTERIIECHNGIQGSMKQAIDYAIEAGQLLTEKREGCKHGEFELYIDRLPFSSKTAYNYIKLSVYKNKIVTVTNLQDAYKQIETIEKQNKQSEAVNQRRRINEYNKTGVKPEGWKRGTDDKEAKKLKEEAEDREQRIKKARDKINEEIDQKEEDNNNKKEAQKESSDILEKATSQLLENLKIKQDFKERIKLSQSGETDLFIEAIMDYLGELEDDNRRIEACQNIIKVCRNIAVELQK